MESSDSMATSKQQTYGTGNTVSYTYDNLGRVETVTYPSGMAVTYAYSGEGGLYSATVNDGGKITKYVYGYDSNGRLISSERRDGQSTGTLTTAMRTRQYYDEVSRLSYQAWQLGSESYAESFTYNSTQDGTLNKHTTATGQTLTMGYDELRRLRSVTGGIYGKTYTYRDITTTQTTNQVSQLAYDLPTDRTFAYEYDNMGNISKYTDANGSVTYTYDNQGQLTKAVAGSTTYNYTYDTVGNILTGNGHTYTYGDSGWKDLLTKVDNHTITYDAIGNPTSYYNGTQWTFGWSNGRRLTSASGGGNTLSYTYDADGIRTSKTVNGTEHTYYYAGGKLLRETYGSNTLDFFYDVNGSPYALKHNNTLYYYITNLQGDVMYIVNGSGQEVAAYTYDPYGNVLTASGDMAEVNPLCYRGYYYDSESGLYYLQSRYYDPEIGRFINADAFASTGQGILGNNMFAYCGNNPVVRLDVDGQAFETIWDIISLGLSLADLIANPGDIWMWISLGGDVIDVLIPFVGGAGEATKAIRITLKFADGFGDLSRASEFGIKSYKVLKNQTRGTGLHAHHIIEQRLVKHLGIDLDSMLSVAVTSSEHQKFTNAWREIFKHGMDYSVLKKDDIWKAAQEVYKDYPELLEAAQKILFG